jgi:hypothetical protein
MVCTHRRLVVLAVASLVSIVPGAVRAQAGPAPAAPVVEKAGTFFVVHCHGGDEALAEQSLAAVEPVWPIVAAAFGVADRKPKQPLHVHLYRTIAGYEAAERELTLGKFQRNLAMTHLDSNSAHIALQPPCSDETLRAIGLPGLTVELLAWEACHVARAEICANVRQHPMWLVDGLAANTALQVLAKVRPVAGDGLPATFATDLVRVHRLQQKKQLPPASAILADRVDDLEFYDRYAVRAVFFRLLAESANRGKLAKVLATVRSKGGGERYPAEVLAAAKAGFGGALDADFVKFVAQQKPEWFEVFRSLVLLGTTWQQIAFPDKNAIAWRQQPVRGDGIRIAGRLRILPGDARQMNVLFGQTPEGDFVSVAFTADDGITVFDYRSKTDAWQRLGDGKAPALRLGYETAFVVEAKGDTVQVTVDAQHWDFKLPRALPDDVVWGLGAQAGSEGAATGTAGLWLDVVAGPAGKPAKRSR